jgi:uncharacterized RDD family membrane protein YckC
MRESMRPLDDLDLQPYQPNPPLADIWKRIFACVLDNALITAGMFLWLFLVLSTANGGNHSELDRLFFVFLPSIPILPTLYFCFFESSKYRATPGAMLFKIQVVSMEYKQINFGQAFVRTLFRWFSTGLLLLGYVVGLFTPKRQTLHDLIAQTLVIEKITPPEENIYE